MKDPKQTNPYPEATRCLQCFDPPCAKGCPAGVNVARFIRLLAQGDPVAAAIEIEQNNPLGLICGYICPHQSLCQQKCTSHALGNPIDIRTLQQFAITEARKQRVGNSALAAGLRPQRFQNEGRVENVVLPVALAPQKVAVVGGGPSGLTCSFYLQQMGFAPEIWEARNSLGGRMTGGIPSQRLNQALVRQETADLASGLTIHYQQKLGRDFTLTDLKGQGYRAVYLASGKWLSRRLSIPGADLQGVYTHDDILTAADWQRQNHQVAVVIGAGNVAMDVARVLLANGLRQVHIFFIAANQEVTAWQEEREALWQAGAVLHMLSIPQAFEGAAGKVQAVRFSRAAVERNAKQPAQWQALPQGTEQDFYFPADMVVMSIGSSAEQKLLQDQGLALDKAGNLLVDANLRTNLPGVFAGGDAVGKGTVVQAVGDGKRAALQIARFLNGGE